MSLNRMNSLMVFSNKFHDLLSCKVLPNHQKKMEVLGRLFHIKYIPKTKCQIFNCKVDLSILLDLHNMVSQFALYKALLQIPLTHSYHPILQSHHAEKYLLSKNNLLDTLMSRCRILRPCKHLSP